MAQRTGSDEPIVITRDLDLDVSVDELWQLVADGERWAEWLTDASDVVVQPAGHGTVVDEDGTERSVTVHSVVPGHSVRFAWWPSDRPGESSLVELVVAPAPSTDGDRSRLTVTETYATSSASTAAMAIVAGTAWDLRLMLMVLSLDTVALART
jgi:uncharacterized protein YndB with AHSA1/START domain